MGVSREGELDVSLRNDVATPVGGVVAHQHGEATAFESLHGLGQVAQGREGWTPIVLDSCNDEGVFASTKDTVLVEKECPPVTADAALEFFYVSSTVFFVGVSDVHAVVMIAHYSINTIGCMELVEASLESIKLAALMIDEVTSKEDDIAFLGIDEVNDTSRIAFVSVSHGTDMHVRELGDTITVELLRQVGEVESLLMNDIVVASDEIAERE